MPNKRISCFFFLPDPLRCFQFWFVVLNFGMLVLIDWSWYYPQCFFDVQTCAGYSTTNWTTSPYSNGKALFPNGLEWLNSKLNGRGFDLHNRQWAYKNYYNTYVDSNKYKFYYDGSWVNVSNPFTTSVPINPYEFFDYLINDGIFIASFIAAINV